MHDIIIYTYIIILGLVCGSFIYTTQMRLIKNKSLFTPSHCDRCKKKIGIIGLIPLFGYFIQKGKCKFCKRKVSLQYPLFEVFNALLFLIIFLESKNWSEFIRLTLFFECLLIISMIDFKTMLIFPQPVLFAFAFQFGFLFYDSANILDHFLGMFIGAGLFHFIGYFFLVIRGKEGLGSGDATLLGLIGFYLGWKLLMPIIFVSSLIGIIYGILNSLRTKKKLSHAIPLGPWLSLASFLCWYFPQTQKLFFF